ncbi:MAG: hypothetical protein ABW061_19100 [Polyangiaceae bacterium]
MTHSRLRLLASKPALVIVTALTVGWSTWHARSSGAPSLPPATALGGASAPHAAQAPAAGPANSPGYGSEAHRDRMQVLAESFDGQAVDENWRPTAEAALRALYAGKDFDGLHTQVQCKSTLCRVTFEYQDAKAAAKAIAKLVKIRPWPGKAFTRHDPTHSSGFSYLAREGMPLPSSGPSHGLSRVASF